MVHWRFFLTCVFAAWMLLCAMSGVSGVLAQTESAAYAPPLSPTPFVPLEDDDIAAEAGITLDASVLYGGIYRVGSWVPVLVTVQNNGVDRSVEARVHARVGGIFAVPIDLPHGARKSVTVYAYVGDFTRRLTVQLFDLQAASQPLTPVHQLALDPQSSDDHLIATITGDGTRLSLPDHLLNLVQVTGVPLNLTSLPDQAAGLAMFDTIVLSDIATAALEEHQRQALYEWVVRGGQLVISGGVGADQTVEGLPLALQPVQVINIQTVAASSIAEGQPSATGNLTLAQVEPITADSRVLAHYTLTGDPTTYPLLVEHTRGSGAVTFFSASLNDDILVFQPDVARFWNNILYQRQIIPPGFVGSVTMDMDRFTESNVATVLTRLPGLQLPSLRTLGVLLLAYVLLVGPGTFLLLRWLDRQVLGWIIVPVLTIIFALVAYGLGYAQRGGDVVLNQITLVEPLQNDDTAATLARVRSFMGVFSPASQTYQLVMAQPALLRPISLQGPWDTRQTDEGGIFRQRRLSPDGTGAEVSDLSIARWSMRAIMADEIHPYTGVTARLVLDGDHVLGEVVNSGDQPLYDIVLIQAEQVAHIGDLSPGESARADLQQTNADGSRGVFEGGMTLSYLIYGDLLDQSYQPGGQPIPPDIQLRMGLLDAIYSYGPTMRNAQPMLLAWADGAWIDLDVVGQRAAKQQLSLIMLTPRIEIASDRVTLEPGWLERQINAGASSSCMGSRGMGFMLNGQMVQQSLRLPRSLMGFQVEEMMLVSGADGGWPGEIVMQLFNWNSGDWLPFTLTGQKLAIGDVDGFLNDRGEIWMMFEQSFPNAGCLYVDAVLTGSLVE